MSDIRSITYEGMANVTTSDTVADPAGPFAGFMCDVAGIVKFTTLRGDTQTRTVNAGVIYPIAITRVWASVTTATGIAGLISMPYKPVFNPGSGTVLP